MTCARRLLSMIALVLCAQAWVGAVSTHAEDPTEEQGFAPLLDGKTTAGWRGYRSQDVPKGWVVEDGALVRRGRGGDMITIEKFGDFELRLEWKIAPGGNSGIMYRVTESEPASYMSGAEYQVVDNQAHPDGKHPATSAASLYGLYAPKDAEPKPAGEFNTARIVVKGNHVEHWLNGRKVVDCDIGGEDWNKRVAGSKFAAWPNFAKAAEGHICLQNHGDTVWFRNIRIKKL